MNININDRNVGKAGNAYAFYIPKALVECSILNKNQEYDIVVIPKGKGKAAKEILDKELNKESVENKNAISQFLTGQPTYNILFYSTSLQKVTA